MQTKVAQRGGKEDAETSHARPQLLSADHSAEPRGRVATLLELQRTHGNRYVQRMLTGRLLNDVRQEKEAPIASLPDRAVARYRGVFPGAPLPLRNPTVVLDEGKTNAAAPEGAPIEIEKIEPANLPEQFDESGLLSGDLTSEESPRVFVNNGKTASSIVYWAGGGGGRGNQGVGDITVSPPTIQSQGPPAAGGTASAWITPGTGTATVTRSYTGVPTGANGTYYITAAASARIDRHEEGHISNSRGHHTAQIVPLELRITQRSGQPNALNQGATTAAAEAALNTFIDWNATIGRFRTNDTAANTPGGSFDTADQATADFILDYGARTVGGVNYAHYVDVPPGPGP